MSRSVAALALGAALPLTALPAHAGSAATNFTITARVSGICVGISASNTTVDYDPLQVNGAAGTDLYGSGTIQMRCLVGTVVDILMSFSVNTVGGQRRLVSGTNALNYALYPPTSGATNAPCNVSAPPSTQWKNTSAGTAGVDFLRTTPFTGLFGVRTFNYCVHVPRGQWVPTGVYTDSIIATVNF